MRYHLHGDPVEKQPGKFYCALCDLFIPEEHFSTHPERDHKERCQRQLKYFIEGRYKNDDVIVDPGNLFHLLDCSSHQVKPIEEKSFAHYITHVCRATRTPRGDAIKDSRRVVRAMGIQTLTEFKNHLASSSPCWEAQVEMEKLFRSYEKWLART